MFQKLRWAVVLSIVFAAGFLARGLVPAGAVVSAQAAAKVYELRTYVVPDDKLGGAQHALPRSHDADLPAPRHRQRGLLHAAGSGEGQAAR